MPQLPADCVVLLNDEIVITLRILGGGFKDFVFSTPILGDMIQFDEHIFFEMGWFHHQLDKTLLHAIVRKMQLNASLFLKQHSYFKVFFSLQGVEYHWAGLAWS